MSLDGYFHFEKFSGTDLIDSADGYTLATSGTGLSISPSGRVGNGLALDGTGTFTISNSSILSMSGFWPVSITAWIFMDSVVAGQQYMIFHQNAGAILHARVIGQTSSSYKLAVYPDTGTGTQGGTLNCGEWNLIGVRLSTQPTEANVLYYSINGGNWTSAVSGFTKGTTALYVGSRSNGTQRFTGVIDEMRVFLNQSLTNTDISTIYTNDRNYSTATDPLASTLVAEGQIVRAVDLNTLLDSTFASLQAANTEKPSLSYYRVNFDHADNTATLTHDFVLVDDFFLEEISLDAGNHNGVITLGADSGALIESISITCTGTGSTYAKSTRYYADTSKPPQLMLKGSTMTLTLSSTAAANSSSVSVALGFVTYRRRN